LQKIYGLLQISEVNLTIEFCNTIIDAHLRTASFSSHPCTCDQIRKASQIFALEGRSLAPDSLEYLTRAQPTLPKVMHTSATCANCHYELSGEEIVAGWFSSVDSNDLSRLLLTGDTKCPACNMNVPPLLKILHVVEDGKEIWSTISLIRPHMLKDLLLKELKGLQVGTNPVLTLRLNIPLFWNMVWWMSMLNLPYQSILGLVSQPSARKPIKFRMPVLEPWSILFDTRNPEDPEIVPYLSQDITTNLPIGLADELIADIRDSKIGDACNEYLNTRNAQPDESVYQRSLYKTLAILNKNTKIVEPSIFGKRFSSELLYSTFELNDLLLRRDHLIDDPTVDRIWEFSELMSHARNRFNHHRDQDFISTLLGLHIEMSFNPSTVDQPVPREESLGLDEDKDPE
jgi:hypothetical protein